MVGSATRNRMSVSVTVAGFTLPVLMFVVLVAMVAKMRYHTDVDYQLHTSIKSPTRPASAPRAAGNCQGGRR